MNIRNLEDRWWKVSEQYGRERNEIQHFPVSISRRPSEIPGASMAVLYKAVAILTLTDELKLEALPGPANSVATVACESKSVMRDMAVIDP